MNTPNSDTKSGFTVTSNMARGFIFRMLNSKGVFFAHIANGHSNMSLFSESYRNLNDQEFSFEFCFASESVGIITKFNFSYESLIREQIKYLIN